MYQRLKGFNVQHILIDDPYAHTETIPTDPGTTHIAHLEDHLAQCDIICLHVPLTPETKHKYSHAFFDKLKHNAIIINLARGGIIDEEALIDFLEKNPEAGAYIDVWEQEPHITPHLQQLLQLPNFLRTPHIGGMTQESVERMHQFDLS